MRYVGVEKPSLEELTHHGVKGMKWGVRKARRAAEKNYKVFTTEAELRRRAKLAQGISEEAYSKLGTKDVVIRKGSELKRVTRNPNENNAPRYLSGDPDTRYRAIVPNLTSTKVQKNYDNQFYEVTYKASQNLKSPSEKNRVDAFVKLMDSPTVKLANGESVTGREYLVRSGYGPALNTIKSRKIGLTLYGYLVSQESRKDEPLNTAYFNSLREKGYNAVVDDNNFGSYAKHPVISLNPKKDLETVKIHQLTTEEIHKAQTEVQPP